MGDMGDDFRALREHRREQKRLHGEDCPGCKVKEPKRIPTRLMPGQRCKVCGYTRLRAKERKMSDKRTWHFYLGRWISGFAGLLDAATCVVTLGFWSPSLRLATLTYALRLEARSE